MAELIFITGGQRSGKSRFAQKIAEQRSDNPVYLATSHIWDEEFAARVARHQADRGDNWTTVEEQRNLSAIKLAGRTVVLDCITLWLNNLFYDVAYSAELAYKNAIEQWDAFVDQDFTLIVVANEIGMGLIPESQSVRGFVDLQGWMNQHIARKAQMVYFMVSGISVLIKNTNI